MTAQIVVAMALVAAALVVAGLVERRRGDPPTQPRDWPVPAQLDPADVDSPTPITLVLFSSATCATCAQVRAGALAATGPDVGFVEAEHGSRRDLHGRYGIEAVPTLLVVDADGVVRASRLGPLTPDDVRDALAEAG